MPRTAMSFHRCSHEHEDYYLNTFYFYKTIVHETIVDERHECSETFNKNMHSKFHSKNYTDAQKGHNHRLPPYLVRE